MDMSADERADLIGTVFELVTSETAARPTGSRQLPISSSATSACESEVKKIGSR